MRLGIAEREQPAGNEGTGMAGRIEDLAERVERLVLSHRSPEQFWLDKSEIADELRRVADEVGCR